MHGRNPSSRALCIIKAANKAHQSWIMALCSLKHPVKTSLQMSLILPFIYLILLKGGGDLVGAVDIAVCGGLFGHANEDRELSTSSSSDNLLVSNGRVVDQSRDVNVVKSALASLVIARKAP